MSRIFVEKIINFQDFDAPSETRKRSHPDAEPSRGTQAIGFVVVVLSGACTFPPRGYSGKGTAGENENWYRGRDSNPYTFASN